MRQETAAIPGRHRDGPLGHARHALPVGLPASKSGPLDHSSNTGAIYLQSVLLLALVVCLLAVPGAGASFAAFPPGEVSFVTRLASMFGLGFAAAGGCAFVLASTHTFRLSFFIPLWIVVSAVLWILALRRASIRDHLRGLGVDIRDQRYPLLLGGLVVLGVLLIHLPFLHYVGGPHYVYYLNGIEIANSHGTPAETLEYGQAWPPATDKIFLDAFTGVLVLFSQNPLIGPGVLLWVSVLGAALGLWASAWELGIRRMGGLLPLLLLGNGIIFNTNFNNAFTEYRSEDFGRAISFCALALGIFAVRKGKWRPAVIAGVTLAVASGTHLIPVVVVVLALCFFGVAQLIRYRNKSSWITTLRQEVIVGATGGVIGLIIRVLAQGSFGLTGASNEAAYAAIHTSFDPTAYLYAGTFPPRKASPPYLTAHQVIDSFVTSALGFHVPEAAAALLLAGMLAATVLLFVLVRTDLRTVGVVGLGLWVGLVVIALLFAYRYHIYIDGTFGVRRLGAYASLGPILVGLGVLEGVLLLLDSLLPLHERTRPAVLIAAAAVPALMLTVWLLPGSGLTAPLSQVSRDRIEFADWVRAHTPCGARFLVNQRSEGTITSLDGREALTEGMGPFLRPSVLPSVVSLMLSTRQFYLHPQSNEAFLRQHDITYVVVARIRNMIGYAGPIGSVRKIDLSAMNATSFLRPVFVKPYVHVYQVVGARVPAPSPLLKGPYLHCLSKPARF
jgi:hypothetical protein